MRAWLAKKAAGDIVMCAGGGAYGVVGGMCIAPATEYGFPDIGIYIGGGTPGVDISVSYAPNGATDAMNGPNANIGGGPVTTSVGPGGVETVGIGTGGSGVSTAVGVSLLGVIQNVSSVIASGLFNMTNLADFYYR